VRAIRGQERGNTETDRVLLEALKCQFNEVELREVVEIAEENLGSAIERGSTENIAPLLLLVSWDLGIRIGLQIVETGNALHALKSEPVQLWALNLVNYLRAYPEGHATTITVVLAGLGLSKFKHGDREGTLIRFH
jgi:hypothetical protein